MHIDDRRYDLTVVINYYAPYVSGLTEAARVIAEQMAARGWRGAVVAGQHDPKLPRFEVLAGVDVYRAPVLAGIGRGKVSIAFVRLAAKLARRSGVMNLHTPMLESGLIARMAGDVPLVTTYHIDLFLPPSPKFTALSRVVNTAAVAAVDQAARVAVARSAATVVNSLDQAEGSKLWPVLRRAELRPIASPCADRTGGEPAFRDGDGLHVGFLGRIVEEKGIEYLVRGFRRHAGADDRLLIGGDYTAVAGGSNIDRIRAEIDGDPRIRILGLLRGRQINDFYASLDVFALPSISESFGIVQAEAMMCGVPSVTTDFPGGRYPVLATGFGRVVPLRDPDALMAAVAECGDMSAEDRVMGTKRAAQLFSLDACIDAYHNLFDEVRRPAPAAARAA
jgi:glycosyltransferase involved in cell wall biosynthesis